MKNKIHFHMYKSIVYWVHCTLYFHIKVYIVSNFFRSKKSWLYIVRCTRQSISRASTKVTTILLYDPRRVYTDKKKNKQKLSSVFETNSNLGTHSHSAQIKSKPLKDAYLKKFQLWWLFIVKKMTSFLFLFVVAHFEHS